MAMTNPKTLRAAVTLSIATTGGALYYYLSDGGKPQRFDELVSRARAELNDFFHVLRNKADIISSPQKLPHQSSAKIQTEEEISATAIAGTPGGKDEEEAIPCRSSSPYCHTCSGARIWVFAEKLRLTHLFNKYTDTATESRDR
ncbi:unnamed protein product [Agarophyton chilense]